MFVYYLALHNKSKSLTILIGESQIKIGGFLI